MSLGTSCYGGDGESCSNAFDIRNLIENGLELGQRVPLGFDRQNAEMQLKLAVMKTKLAFYAKREGEKGSEDKLSSPRGGGKGAQAKASTAT